MLYFNTKATDKDSVFTPQGDALYHRLSLQLITSLRIDNKPQEGIFVDQILPPIGSRSDSGLQYPFDPVGYESIDVRPFTNHIDRTNDDYWRFVVTIRIEPFAGIANTVLRDRLTTVSDRLKSVFVRNQPIGQRWTFVDDLDSTFKLFQTGVVSPKIPQPLKLPRLLPLTVSPPSPITTIQCRSRDDVSTYQSCPLPTDFSISSPLWSCCSINDPLAQFTLSPYCLDYNNVGWGSDWYVGRPQWCLQHPDYPPPS